MDQALDHNKNNHGDSDTEQGNFQVRFPSAQEEAANMENIVSEIESTLLSGVSSISTSLTRLKATVEVSEVMRGNSTACEVDSALKAVPIVSDEGAKYPEWFPGTLGEFNGLLRPEGASKLSELAVFYGISRDSDDTTCHKLLAEKLGIDYSKASQATQ